MNKGSNIEGTDTQENSGDSEGTDTQENSGDSEGQNTVVGKSSEQASKSSKLAEEPTRMVETAGLANKFSTPPYTVLEISHGKNVLVVEMKKISGWCFCCNKKKYAITWV